MFLTAEITEIWFKTLNKYSNYSVFNQAQMHFIANNNHAEVYLKLLRVSPWPMQHKMF